MASNWFDVFAYGSNMSMDRLRCRAPSARFLTIGWLKGHRLQWHKRGLDGSGKCDGLHTGNQEDILWGAVFRIDACDRPSLDQAEHIGIGYQIRHVEVTTAAGPCKAMIYSALLICPNLKPFDWYKNYVLQGATELSLPTDYIQRIEAVESIPDPDPQRAALHNKVGHGKFGGAWKV